jgi:hypothetical protein
VNQAAHFIEPQIVRFERLLPGPIERVWDYLTQPELQRTWLSECASQLSAVTRCQPLRSIEYSMCDSSVVTMELEPRGADVKLVLTHRLPGWLAGAAAILAVAVLTFSVCRPDQGKRQPQRLGPEITAAAPSLNSLHLQPSHFTLC